MKLINLEITTKIGCTNMCDYCPQEMLSEAYRKISNTRYMTIKTFTECLEKVDKDVKIGFTGFCEPFMNRRAIKMVEIAAERNPVYISTTLVGLKISDIERLEKINFLTFDVHLPSKTGDKIPTNDKQIEVLKAVVDSYIQNKSYHYHGDEIHPAVSFVKAKRAGTHSRAGNVEGIKGKVKNGSVRCVRGFAHPVLLPNGDLDVCCMDYGLKHILGNLLIQSVDEIYAGKEFKDFIAMTKKNSGSICHSCTAYGVRV